MSRSQHAPPPPSDNAGATALMLAVEANSPSCIKWLLEKGADPKAALKTGVWLWVCGWVGVGGCGGVWRTAQLVLVCLAVVVLQLQMEVDCTVSSNNRISPSLQP